ncbi:MAG: zf-HC2 domain-containing protein [Clostridia bacterium]|nr:zf-HC2 domain-containing protein [Clostridia bacterium]
MNINCDIIMDLVAVYKDGMASDGTRALVRAHLRECPSCRKMYAGYQISQNVRPTPAPAPKEGYAEGYNALIRHMRIKHIREVASVMFAAGVFAAIGVYAAAKAAVLPQIPEKESNDR